MADNTFNAGTGITIGGADLAKWEYFIGSKWVDEFEREMDKATGRSAKYILSQIRSRILSKSYVPNSLWTAKRKGFNSVAEAIPLVETGGLIREAIAAKRKSIGVWEVGVIEDKTSRRTGAKASKYVRALHEGVTVTSTIRGVRRTFRIPPRPFLRSVWEDMAVRGKVHKDWSDTIEMILRKHGKL
jgi:hypothetical protein